MVPVLLGQHGLTYAEDGEDVEREQEDWVVAAGPWTRKGGISASPPPLSRQASNQHAEEVWNTLHTEDGMELLEEQGVLQVEINSVSWSPEEVDRREVARRAP